MLLYILSFLMPFNHNNICQESKGPIKLFLKDHKMELFKDQEELENQTVYL